MSIDCLILLKYPSITGLCCGVAASRLGTSIPNDNTMKEAQPAAIRLVDYTPPDFLISAVRLQFDLRDQGTRVRSHLSVKRNGQHQRPLCLDGEQLITHAVSLNGEQLTTADYALAPTCLTIPTALDDFVLETEVEIAPEANSALEGLYRSNDLFCTQCEAEGFRRITWYLDRPDVMALFETSIEADAMRFPVVLSNGNLIAQEQLADNRQRVLWQDPFPKPCYLFALVAGDLAMLEDSFRTASGRVVTLRIYSEPDNIARCGFAMESLKKAMRWDEEVYGREYDLDIFTIVAVNDFNMGAMENKGLNVFNAKLLLADAATATDADYENIEAVVAHEYFHNWSGNRVTCRDWFQLSLKEGFTVFRDQEFSADMRSPGLKRIEDVRMLRAHQFAEDASPMAHPVRPDAYVEINNFYTLTVYEKGAELVRMLAHLLGRDAFRRATDLYFERHDGKAVTTDDFVACMAEISGRDLTQFKRWYAQAGTPVLSVKAEYDAAAQRYQLHCTQHTPPTYGQPDKLPVVIPIKMALLDDEGRAMHCQLANSTISADAFTLEMTDSAQTFVFAAVPSAPVPSLLRGFSAPVKLDFAYSTEQLLLLMAKDSDDFVRWDAAQTLHQRVLLAQIAQPGAPLPTGYLDALAAVLHADDDPALVSELLALPAESYLGDLMPVVDVDGIHAARSALRQQLATTYQDAMLDKIAQLQTTTAYQPEHRQAGQRALKNQLLGMLAEAGQSQAFTMVQAQYAAQHNMTDVLAALSIAVNWGSAALRETLLTDFVQRWSKLPLVMDKWFAVQAAAQQMDVPERVQQLAQHAAFSLRNPNRVRALYGTLAANQVVFHRQDGVAYRMLADLIIALNSVNPQIAARLLRGMSRWERFDPARQERLRAELERIRITPNLSTDIHEIINRSVSQ